jgi:hypothetical protein
MKGFPTAQAVGFCPCTSTPKLCTLEEEKMDAEQAWQSALGQLQMEMPKASFDTWVRDTQIASYEDGLFTVTVHNAYARDWLESRLSSTVTRLLMGIMNRSVEVTFVVRSNESSGMFIRLSHRERPYGYGRDPGSPSQKHFTESPLHLREFCGRSKQPAGACRLAGRR